ncbi:MAG: phenylalanine--tRNA ligase subunit beta [Alphaproteobacteria bacterium]|nr:phenylalanine--tRNA ligase subunit beta [Alphaproteobacteria bacterium]
MKFTLSWLKDHLDTKASLEEITEKLTAIGLEVESVEDRAKDFTPFKVAHVVQAEQHPDADRLKLCKVDTGDGIVQVVCGAPNARKGMKAVFAPEGSYIPGLDVTLKKGVIRGQESNGMLVSEREMNLSDEHEGIIDLPEDTPIGKPLAQLYGLDDPVIDIAITPNRADCTGVRGIARDLAAAGLGTLKPLDISEIKGAFVSPIDVSLKFDKSNENACPHFIGRYVKNVENKPSPKWLRDRLKSIGLRPNSALVDITNYLSLDHGRPLHVFDADKLKGDVYARLAKNGERLEGLDDKTYELSEDMTVICDDSGVIGLAGVMGGEPTGCTEDTKNVFIEAAYFDPMRTAKTGRATGINSDARYRFERGIDPDFTKDGMELATLMVLNFCGGEASESVEAGSAPDVTHQVKYKPSRAKEQLGFDISEEEQKDILSHLGFTVKSEKDSWSITNPSWRNDIQGAADIVEEIGRIKGYENIEDTPLPEISGSDIEASETLSFSRARIVRASLSANGFDECITWSFIADKTADMFGANDNPNKKGLSLLNPISSELDTMRPSILPNLLEAAKRNTDRGFANGKLFEVGPVFQSSKPNGFDMVASGIIYGEIATKHWSDTKPRIADAFDAKDNALLALESIGAPATNLQVSRDAPDHYHPGRSGALRLGKNILAVFGEIHPGILQDMDIEFPVSGFEIYLEKTPVPRKKGSQKSLLKVSNFQPVTRDFAFLVERNVDSDQFVRAAMSADKKLVTDVTVFDIYMGKNIDENQKSVALSVTLQPAEKTLTDKEIESVSKSIIDEIEKRTGGKLRG